MRPSWDDTWLSIASSIALRSRCTNRQVGAVIVDASQRPVATGYNGPPAGLVASVSVLLPGCASFCQRGRTQELRADHDNCVAIHAEANAMLFADRRDYVGGTLYTTTSCCLTCAKLAANSGVARVVMLISPNETHLRPEEGRTILNDSGVRVTVAHAMNDYDGSWPRYHYEEYRWNRFNTMNPPDNLNSVSETK